MKTFKEYLAEGPATGRPAAPAAEQPVAQPAVAPRPDPAKLPKAAQRWDQFYANTNNPDGSPKAGAKVATTAVQASAPATQAANPAPTTQTSPSPAQQDNIKKVQQIQDMLKQKGIDLGPTGVDGRIGKYTLDGILKALGTPAAAPAAEPAPAAAPAAEPAPVPESLGFVNDDLNRIMSIVRHF